MRKKRFAFFMSLIILLMTVFQLTSMATPIVNKNEAKYVGIAYNTYTLDIIGYLEGITVLKSSNKINIKFSMLDEEYDIEAKSILITDKNDEYMTFSSEEKQYLQLVYCNIIVGDNNITGSIISKNGNLPNRFKNQKNNFSFILTINKNVDLNEIIRIATETSEIKSNVEKNIETIKQLHLEGGDNVSEGIILNSSTNHHVLASGWSIPFLISSGVSEGWVRSTYAYGSVRVVDNLSYSIAYNWPSDGISLWYDYINSDRAYSSPAFPKAGLTSVTGSWFINASKGKFVAETTVSAIVKGFPLMWAIYDVTNLY